MADTKPAPGGADRPYHHGDLRRALLEECLAATAESGPTGWSLRELARRVGVSNGATTRHFRDKRALMTAAATDGFARMADALEAGWTRRQRFDDVGAAYVAFATTAQAHFDILCRPELYDAEDDALARERSRVFAVLYGPLEMRGEESPEIAGAAAWALVHGIATLWRQDLLPPALAEDPVGTFRAASRYLFQAPSKPEGRRRP